MENILSALELPHGRINLPAFLPDATHGIVRSVDSADLESIGTQAVVMNTFHLMQRPGSSTVQALGGLHRMAGWPWPIMTDSGGFQAYSLIRQNPKLGRLATQGITFQPEGAARKYHLTPEKAVQLQSAYGSDIVVCLDDCTHPDDPIETQVQSVRRTVAWAKRCRKEFDRLMGEKRLEPAQRPRLFAVVQGGRSRDLRRQCAEALLEIGFDGYGFGGWPMDGAGSLLSDMLAYTRELIPRQYPLHALGVGHPLSVIECARMGYDLFDSALPTRDARRGRLYRWAGEDGSIGRFDLLYIQDDKHIKDNRPIQNGCDCLSCRRYSIGFLHHLFQAKESAYLRLATLHNLRFMNRLMDHLRRLPADHAPALAAGR
ncbi:MAG: tRNA guanosine(34) transglycosylase Tgt [Anaerolineae bacterium]|nr:tRNA guanosine(34) transglycosylase Tgt [Thermoflexales bacterium]MDW8408335.1 tRNA guanosine(34) transglycosylase Tgt [Anaerolineae bacterium]